MLARDERRLHDHSEFRRPQGHGRIPSSGSFERPAHGVRRVARGDERFLQSPASVVTEFVDGIAVGSARLSRRRRFVSSSSPVGLVCDRTPSSLLRPAGASKGGPEQPADHRGAMRYLGMSNGAGGHRVRVPERRPRRRRHGH
jgi:hypothetical protein